MCSHICIRTYFTPVYPYKYVPIILYATAIVSYTKSNISHFQKQLNCPYTYLFSYIKISIVHTKLLSDVCYPL